MIIQVCNVQYAILLHKTHFEHIWVNVHDENIVHFERLNV